jgi:Phage tail tube protein, GTA-gp10
MSEPEIGGGRIEIEIAGKTGYLEPSLEACIALDKMAGPGGLASLAERCRNLSFETICEVIGHGLVIDGNKLGGQHKAKLLPKAVYEAGVINVAEKAMQFVGIVWRGGKELPDDEDDTESDEAPLG